MLYRITDTEFHGMAMVATQDIEPGPDGFTILEENAILRMPPTGSEDDISGPMPSILDKFDPQIWTDWCIFRKQPAEVKRKILDMYHEMDCRHATWLLKYLADKNEQQNKQQEQENNDDEQKETLETIERGSANEEMSRWILDHIDEFVRFTMVRLLRPILNPCIHLSKPCLVGCKLSNNFCLFSPFPAPPVPIFSDKTK